MTLRHLLVTDSSNIASVGYDPKYKRLQVAFSTGATYQYEAVTPIQWANFTSAPSMGQWLAQNIKGRPEHPYVRLSELITG